MDSMRSMQGSLPLSSRRRRDAVLSDFRQTAQSLTALYKNACSEIDQAYSDGTKEGAREVLEILLSGMDRENIGLQEGEGWRVRQMVLELFQGLGGQDDKDQRPQTAEEDETEEKEQESVIDSSPLKDPRQELQTTQKPTSEPAVQSQTSLDKISPAESTHPDIVPSPTPQFTFTSPHTRPLDDMLEIGSPEQLHHNTIQFPHQPLFSFSSPYDPYRPRIPAKSTFSITPLGPGAGTKRKTSPQTQRQLSSTGISKDGSKRTRMEH